MPTSPAEPPAPAVTTRPAGPAGRVVPTAPLAALTLVAGYAVAAGTGVRALGGVVLVAGLAGCLLLWRRRHLPGRRAAVLVGVFLVLFVASHLLALAVGAWPSVLLVAVAMLAATWWLADRAGVASTPGR